MTCPCGRGASYEECCEPLHLGQPAPSAERLMRSRYSAFALGRSDYLLQSWHRSTRPESSAFDADLDPDLNWQRLFVEPIEGGGAFDSMGFVSFTAIARTQLGRHEQRERSYFVREDGHWFYVDGEPL